MAKQAVGPIERHLDKGVLGLTALLLLGAVGLYLVRSPNTIEMNGRQVGPGEVDQVVRDNAKTVLARIRGARPEVEMPEDPLPELEQTADLPSYAGIKLAWPSAVSLMPRVPDVGATRTGQTKLAEAVPPGKPMCLVGRSEVDLLPAVSIGDAPLDEDVEEGVYYEPINWVTIAAPFDRQKQREFHRQAGYERGRQAVYLVGVELQRRRQLPDGTWPEEWETVPHYAPVLPPFPPQIALSVEDDEVTIPAAIREDVRRYFGLIKDYQIDVLRPLFPDIVRGDHWKLPEFEGLDLFAMDVEFDEDLVDGRDRYSHLLADETEEVEESTKSLREQQEDYLEETKRIFAAGGLDEAYERAIELQKQSPNRSIVRDLEKLIEDIEQAIRDRDRDRKPGEDEFEDEDEMQVSPVQIVWVHDADIGSVEGGATYQYRMRALLYNRYAAAPDGLEDPTEAGKVYVTGPWSDPSDPVEVPRDIRFFLASDRPDSVRLHMFKWFDGDWVDYKKYVEIGEAIGGTHRVSIRLPSGEIDRPPVSFETGEVLVDLDQSRPLRERRGGGSNGGFDFDQPKPTTAMVYMDAQGNLHERLLDLDKGSDDYKQMKTLVEKPKVRRRRPPPDRGSSGGGRGPGAGAGGGGGGRGPGMGGGGGRGGGGRGPGAGGGSGRGRGGRGRGGGGGGGMSGGGGRGPG